MRVKSSLTYRRFSIARVIYFIGFSVFFSWILLQKNYPLSQNSFYHLQIAKLYSQGLFNLDTLDILEKSSFNSHFVNQHTLYHLYLVPFIFLFKELIAIKIANAVGISALLVTIAFLLRQLNVVFPFLWPPVILFLDKQAFKRLLWERPEPWIAIFRDY